MQLPDLEKALSASLYERHAPAVLTYLLKQLDTREDAEDILLEVFTAILEKNISLHEDERSQRAWILTVARNKVADHYRRAGRYPRVSLASVEEQLYELTEHEPEQTILRQETYEQLQTHIQSLSEVQQEILQLRFEEGLRCREIGRVVQRTEGAVRALLYRALKQLREIYEA